MEKRTNLFSFNLDLTLINQIRLFKHNDHKFEEGFIESIYALLFYYQGSQQAEIFNEYSTVKQGITMREMVLSIHFRFSSISNLEVLTKALNNETQIPNLNRQMFNSTNILNDKSLVDLHKTLNYEILNQKKVILQFFNQYKLSLKPNYFNEMTISIIEEDNQGYDKEKNILYLSYNYLSLAFISNGKLEPYITANICFILNSNLKIQIYHVLLSFILTKPNADMQSAVKNYSNSLDGIYQNWNQFNLDKEQFKIYRDKLVDLGKNINYDRIEVDKLLREIEKQLDYLLIARLQTKQHYIEKLLIGMLGHPISRVRDKAIIYLNALYDGVTWQMNSSYHPIIVQIGQKFRIQYLIESYYDDDIVLMLKSFIFQKETMHNVLSYFKPNIEEFRIVKDRRFVVVSIDFGIFQRCGIYDWKLRRMKEDGNFQSIYKIADMDRNEQKKDIKALETRPVQGRFIVHPKNSRDLQMHEVIVDLQDSVVDDQGSYIKRGNFKKVTEKLDYYKDQGINCIYLAGVFERDNGMFLDQFSRQPHFTRPDTSFMSVTSRVLPNSMLGGQKMFLELIKKAKLLDIKIIVDSLTRICSSRMAKKYKKHIQSTLDNNGKQISVYGTNGRGFLFDDTAILNYRKKKCWDLLLSELVTMAQDLSINGIHLDNGQSWPQIFKLDVEEMYRKESDQSFSYQKKEIFNGDIVVMDEDCGFWGSKLKDTYPNPFLIKLSRHLWKFHPEFLIVSEVWGQVGGFDSREISIIQSGPIPRLFKLPIAIGQFFGQNLKKDGNVQQVGRKDVNSFKKWYEASKLALPTGSIVIQSTTYHTWPYPALLFKKGTWSAIDLFFFLPNITITFIGEMEGKASKVKAANIYAQIKSNEENQEMKEDTESDQEEDDIRSPKPKAKKQNKFFSIMSDFTKLRERKVQNQKNKIIEIDKQFLDINDLSSQSFIEEYQVQGFGYNVEDKSLSSQQGGSGFRKRRSSSYLKITSTDQQQDELKLINQEGWGFIESLKDIHKHYKHRRAVKASRKFLRQGKFCSLLCEHVFGWHTHVLCFASYTKKQMGIVAINFNDGPIDGIINLKQLNQFFPDFETSKIVVELQILAGSQKQPENNLFFIGEFVNDKLVINLNGFDSAVYSIDIYTDDEEKIKLANEQSMKRLLDSLKNQKTIYSNDIAYSLYKLLRQHESLQKLADGYGFLYDNYLKSIDINNLVSLTNYFKEDIVQKNKLFAFYELLLEQEQEFIKRELEEKKELDEEEETQITQSTQNPDQEEQKDQKETEKTQSIFSKQIEYFSGIKNNINQNILGPIVIITPEYGKYTKTGGLGVMTDELSTGLADLGENVVVITPWYEDKAKKNPKALTDDGINHLFNLEIYVGGEKIISGVHHGIVGGVRVFFVHHSLYFPAAYEGEDPAFVMKCLVLFTKTALEILCKSQIIPSLIITNDWFCGLIPAYIKEKKFGEVFIGTKVFHIIHNLDETYQGRLYPKPSENSFNWLHELPQYYLVDETWEQFIVNPSRCAFLACDNWGTVSHSYKYQILSESSLRFLLQRYPNAFSFPNGLKKNERIQILKEKTGSENNHLQAKEKLQQKYFGFKNIDDSIPLFGFVGRITEQKGVHLILDAAEDLIRMNNFKIQIIIGGPANYKEQYSFNCVGKMEYLFKKYPSNIWCAPDKFFYDSPLLNLGCDFGIMPSKFEPGGIVQHEFFVGSTPIIAMKTGGLQDTVHEYNYTTQKGSGFIFEYHTQDHYTKAVQRATHIFQNKQAYQKLRENAFNAVIDVSDVTRAYAAEFYRMFNKNFLDKELIKKCKERIKKDFDIYAYEKINYFPKQKGQLYSTNYRIKQQFEKVLYVGSILDSRPVQFRFNSSKKFIRSLHIVGSFDDWKNKWSMNYDQFSSQWRITINLHPGEYLYKFLVDDEKWVCDDEQPKDTDIFGNINNIISVI